MLSSPLLEKNNHNGEWFGKRYYNNHSGLVTAIRDYWPWLTIGTVRDRSWHGLVTIIVVCFRVISKVMMLNIVWTFPPDDFKNRDSNGRRREIRRHGTATPLKAGFLTRETSSEWLPAGWVWWRSDQSVRGLAPCQKNTSR